MPSSKLSASNRTGKKGSAEGSQMSTSTPLRTPNILPRCGATAGWPEISLEYVGDTVVATEAAAIARPISSAP